MARWEFGSFENYSAMSRARALASGQSLIFVQGRDMFIFICVIVKDKHGAEFAVVPFTGTGTSISALLGGHVDVISGEPAAYAGHLKAGTVRILGVPHAKRLEILPDVPTMRESGIDIVLVGQLQVFIVGPKGIPEDRVNMLHAAFKKGLESEQYKAAAKANYLPSIYLSPKDLMKRLEAVYEWYGDFTKKVKFE